ncbi:MAG: hypothetical protein JNJ78_24505 [Anaerolineae bacterium]|nr:hypothetical protein [Anaerolineae bacterium]
MVERLNASYWTLKWGVGASVQHRKGKSVFGRSLAGFCSSSGGGVVVKKGGNAPRLPPRGGFVVADKDYGTPSSFATLTILPRKRMEVKTGGADKLF